LKRMYYHNFPQAPTALVSGIACVAQIPTIVGAYVGVADNSLFLDVFQNADWKLRVRHMEAIAEICGVTLDELEVGPGIDAEHLSVSLEITCFDFSNLGKVTAKSDEMDDDEFMEYFAKMNEPPPPSFRKRIMAAAREQLERSLPGVEDSEEGIQAHLALQKVRGSSRRRKK